jgi:hypothetical protein
MKMVILSDFIKCEKFHDISNATERKTIDSTHPTSPSKFMLYPIFSYSVHI